MNDQDERDGVDAFPLCWPEEWLRTVASTRGRHPRWKVIEPDSKYYGAPHRYHFLDELRRVEWGLQSLQGLSVRNGGAPWVSQYCVSSNAPLSKSGRPTTPKKILDDPGVAIYWWAGQMDRPKRYALACDRWRYVEDNLSALADAFEALEKAAKCELPGFADRPDRFLTEFARPLPRERVWECGKGCGRIFRSHWPPTCPVCRFACTASADSETSRDVHDQIAEIHKELRERTR